MMQGVPRDQAVAILTAVHDRLEAAERQGDAALESALAATPSGVAVHEIDGRAAITRVNPEELRLLGYRPDQMIGQRASEFIVMQDATQHTITERLRGNRELRPFVKTYRRADGSPVTMILVDRFRMANGSIVGIRTAMMPVKLGETRPADA
jgi:PAS domain S-box-containing protein